MEAASKTFLGLPGEHGGPNILKTLKETWRDEPSLMRL